MIERFPVCLLTVIFQFLWTSSDFHTLQGFKWLNKSWYHKWGQMKSWWRFVWANWDRIHEEPYIDLDRWWIDEAFHREPQPKTIRFTGCRKFDKLMIDDIPWSSFSQLESVQNLFPDHVEELKKRLSCYRWKWTLSSCLHFTLEGVTAQDWVRRIEDGGCGFTLKTLISLCTEQIRPYWSQRASMNLFYLFLTSRQHQHWDTFMGSFLGKSEVSPNYAEMFKLLNLQEQLIPQIREHHGYRRQITVAILDHPNRFQDWQKLSNKLPLFSDVMEGPCDSCRQNSPKKENAKFCFFCFLNALPSIEIAEIEIRQETKDDRQRKKAIVAFWKLCPSFWQLFDRYKFFYHAVVNQTLSHVSQMHELCHQFDSDVPTLIWQNDLTILHDHMFRYLSNRSYTEFIRVCSLLQVNYNISMNQFIDMGPHCISDLQNNNRSLQRKSESPKLFDEDEDAQNSNSSDQE